MENMEMSTKRGAKHVSANMSNVGINIYHITLNH